MGRVALAVVAGLAALQLLPDLLKPPQAPPLAADVGLPRAGEAEREIAIREAGARPLPEPGPRPRPRLQPEPRPRREPAPRASRGASPATAVIGTEPRPRNAGRKRCRPVESRPACGRKPSGEPPAPPAAPSPTDPYVPPPAPAPAPEPPPPAAPDPPPGPSDGSVEFAPH